jgi:hypothetical protein
LPCFVLIFTQCRAVELKVFVEPLASLPSGARRSSIIVQDDLVEEVLSLVERQLGLALGLRLREVEDRVDRLDLDLLVDGAYREHEGFT